MPWEAWLGCLQSRWSPLHLPPLTTRSHGYRHQPTLLKLNTITEAVQHAKDYPPPSLPPLGGAWYSDVQADPLLVYSFWVVCLLLIRTSMQIVGRCGLPSDIWALSTILWEVCVSHSFTPCCKSHAGRSIMSVLVLLMHLKMGDVKVDPHECFDECV